MKTITFLTLLLFSLATYAQECIEAKTPFEELIAIENYITPKERECPEKLQSSLSDDFNFKLKFKRDVKVYRKEWNFFKKGDYVEIKSLSVEKNKRLPNIEFNSEIISSLDDLRYERKTDNEYQKKTYKDALDGYGVELVCIPKTAHVERSKIINKKTGEEIILNCTDGPCSKFYYSYRESASERPLMISKIFSSAGDLKVRLDASYQQNKIGYTNIFRTVSSDMTPEGFTPEIYSTVVTLGMVPMLTLPMDVIAAPIRIVKNANQKGANKKIERALEKDQEIDAGAFGRVFRRLYDEIQ